GEWFESNTKIWEDVYNPGSGEIIAKTPMSTREETKAAIEVAQTPFEEWSKTSSLKRQKIMFKLQHLIMENKDNLDRTITLENGKKYADGLGEVGRGIENVEHAANVVKLTMGDSSPSVATDVEVTNYKYPIGVVGAICPFNFPMMVPFWMFPLAIATGN